MRVFFQRLENLPPLSSLDRDTKCQIFLTAFSNRQIPAEIQALFDDPACENVSSSVNLTGSFTPYSGDNQTKN